MHFDWNLILNGVVAFLIGSWIVSVTKPSSGDSYWSLRKLFKRQDKERAKLEKKLGLKSDNNLTSYELVELANEKGIDTTAYDNTFEKDRGNFTLRTVQIAWGLCCVGNVELRSSSNSTTFALPDTLQL